MRVIDTINVAKVLHTLADRIKNGDVMPYMVTATDDHVEVYFHEAHHMGEARGSARPGPRHPLIRDGEEVTS